VSRVQPNANLQPERRVLRGEMIFAKIREESFENLGNVSNDMSLKKYNRKRLIERGVKSEIREILLGRASDS